VAVVDEDLAAFGRRVASTFPGFDPDTPGFDAYRYGRLARYKMGKGQNVPDPHDYVEGGEVETPAAREVVREDDNPRVRIGRVEMRLSREEPARHRPQHHLHKGQRSSGRYRRSGFRLTRRSDRPRYRRR
jgi:hypothetical protein